jgi:hypothetical protein
MEKYLPIKGFVNYEISNFGNVRNIKFGRILKPQITKRGKYYQVTLSQNNKGHVIKIHRTVAITFIENPNNYPEVDHRDRNRLNNNIENLRWVTQETNRENSLFGKKSPYPYLTFNGLKYLVYFSSILYEFDTIEEAFQKFKLFQKP